MVTAHRTASLVRNCARHGVRVLEKPIRPEDQREALAERTAAVREEVSKIAGVSQVDVSAATGKLVITSANPLADTDVVAAVDEAGYEAVATGSA